MYASKQELQFPILGLFISGQTDGQADLAGAKPALPASASWYRFMGNRETTLGLKTMS
jgi:hypothetical protein